MTYEEFIVNHVLRIAYEQNVSYSEAYRVAVSSLTMQYRVEQKRSRA